MTGNEGFEYWLPRPHPSPLTASEEKREHRRPIIILGGGRETLKEKGYGMYETNDGVLDPEASELLRKFLPTVFPGKFDTNGTVEVEWVSNIIITRQREVAYGDTQTGIMGFTRSGDPFVSQSLSTLRRSSQDHNRLGEPLMPTRSPLLGSISVRGTRGMECLARMDGRTLFRTRQLANDILVRKRSHLLFGQIRNGCIGHHHIGSLDTISPKNSNKHINVMLVYGILLRYWGVIITVEGALQPRFFGRALFAHDP